MLSAIPGRAFPCRKPARCLYTPCPPSCPRPMGGLGGVTLSFRDRGRSRGWAVIAELLGMEATVQLPLARVALVPAQTPSFPALCQGAQNDLSPQGCGRVLQRSRALINPSVGRQEGPGQAVSALQENPAAPRHFNTCCTTYPSQPLCQLH